MPIRPLISAKDKLGLVRNNVSPAMEANNLYNENDEYSESHPNALSTGDERGRGAVNGIIGTSIDIAQRTMLMAANEYGPNNEYTGP